jgi:hypothetical protein
MIWLVLVLGSVGAGWMLGRGDAAANFRLAAACAPESLLTVTLGASIGLYGRDRIRLRRTYASPTAAYLGKALFFAALAPAAAWILAPLGWPASSLPLCAAGCGAGAALWIGNLPSRL